MLFKTNRGHAFFYFSTSAYCVFIPRLRLRWQASYECILLLLFYSPALVPFSPRVYVGGGGCMLCLPWPYKLGTHPSLKKSSLWGIQVLIWIEDIPSVFVGCCLFISDFSVDLELLIPLFFTNGGHDYCFLRLDSVFLRGSIGWQVVVNCNSSSNSYFTFVVCFITMVVLE